MAVKTKQENTGVKTADENATKKFDVTYMLITIIAMVVILVVAVSAYYKSTFVMFSPDKVAKQYEINIAAMDEYDAMKYTVMIKDAKLGDFIYDNYMEKYVPKDGEEVKTEPLTAEEEGKKLSEILDAMYPVFCDLTETYGFSDYDSLLTKYFEIYNNEYRRIYGNGNVSRDSMFSAFEGNATKYSESFKMNFESVYGNGSEYAEKYLGSGKATLADDDIYSPGYGISLKTKVVKEYSGDEVSTYIQSLTDGQKKAYEAFGISADEIKEVVEVEAVKTLRGDGDQNAISEKNAEWEKHPDNVTIVKIGSQWYVDFTA